MFKDKCLQHYLVGETKITCKMISGHKEQWCEKYTIYFTIETFLLERVWHWLNSGYSEAYLEIIVWFYRIWAIMLPFSWVLFTSGTWTFTSNASWVNLLYLYCLLSFVVCYYLKFGVSLYWNIKLLMNWKSWKSFRGRLLFMIL